MLTLFALGILLIDFMLPKEMKWANAATAFVGVLFSAAGVYKIQLWLGPAPGTRGMLQTMLVDRFAIYFFYLFLAATAISILISVRYLEVEHENHGEYYSLMLLSVAGMMCMAAGAARPHFHWPRTDGHLHLRLSGFSAARPAFERSGTEVSVARSILLWDFCLRTFAAVRLGGPNGCKNDQ